MYNRYIPQPDGSFQRRHHPDKKPEPAQKRPTPPNENPSQAPKRANTPKSVQKDESPIGFLKQLLPKDFDTGDMIVILLLLLIAGDKEEDRAHALLTIALYLVM